MPAYGDFHVGDAYSRILVNPTFTLAPTLGDVEGVTVDVTA